MIFWMPCSGAEISHMERQELKSPASIDVLSTTAGHVGRSRNGPSGAEHEATCAWSFSARPDRGGE